MLWAYRKLSRDTFPVKTWRTFQEDCNLTGHGCLPKAVRGDFSWE
uniref:Uncharacterized protein n=1 Tax=Arundo donax TaxID=35708 RepID=A0A0A8YEH4_ARUDO